jgi:immune inhibitor A
MFLKNQEGFMSRKTGVVLFSVICFIFTTFTGAFGAPPYKKKGAKSKESAGLGFTPEKSKFTIGKEPKVLPEGRYKPNASNPHKIRKDKSGSTASYASGAAAPAGVPLSSLSSWNPGTTSERVILMMAAGPSSFPQIIDPVNHVPSYYTNSYFNTMNPASVNAYYNEVSCGIFSFFGDVLGTGWVNLPNYIYQYGEDYNGATDPFIVYYFYPHTMAAFDATGVDFHNYNGVDLDTNGNGILEREEAQIVIIHAGSDQALTGNPWDITAASYDLTDYPSLQVECGGMMIPSFVVVSEDEALGTICHELGHAIGLPDLYDTGDSSAGELISEGIGEWCLMGSGNWNGATPGSSPAHMSAWCKVHMGWVTPDLVAADTASLQVNQIETCGDIYKIPAKDAATTNEYYLVENRQSVGFDSYLPGFGSGLLIWHVDENMPDNRLETHRLVDLEQADQLHHLNNTSAPMNRGDALDAYYLGNGATFDGCTNTNLQYTSYSYSQVNNASFSNFSATGALMTLGVRVTPLISMFLPVDESYVTTPNIGVAGYVDDISANVSISVNGTVYTSALTPMGCTASFNQTVTLTPGINVIVITATDAYGNVDTETRTVYMCVYPDAGFSNGFVSRDSSAGGNADDWGNAITTWQDGKIYVAGRSAAAEGGYNMLLWRLNSDGTTDSTFGSGGIVNYDSSSSITAEGWDIKMDYKGRIVVAGHGVNPGGHVALIMRYTNAGIPDATFAGVNQGRFEYPGYGAYTIAFDSKNKIVAAARLNSTTLRLIKLNENGSLDGTFGNGAGYVDFAGGSDDYSRIGLAVGSDDMIYVTDTKNSDLAYWSFNPNGVIGWSRTVSDILAPGAVDKGNSIAISPWGVVYITGSSRLGSDSTLFITRLDMRGGGIDGSFGTAGIAKYVTTGQPSAGNKIAFDHSARILITGTLKRKAFINDAAVWRYSSSGMLDNTFTSSGYVLGLRTENGPCEGFSSVLAQSGEIYMTGSYTNAGLNRDMAVWALKDGCISATPSATPTQSACFIANNAFAGNGYTSHNNMSGGNAYDGGFSLVSNPAGDTYYITGKSAASEGGANLVIWKYSSAGVRDTSYNVNYDPSPYVSGFGSALKMDGSGRLIVVGNETNPGGTLIRTFRYLSNGTRDTTFNAGQGQYGGVGYNFVFDSSGRIIVIGRYGTTTLRMFRMSANGINDNTFGTNGKVDFAGGSSGNQSKMGICIDSTNNIYVTDSLNNDLVVWKFNPNGGVITTFGVNGKATITDILGSGAIDKGNAIAVNSSSGLLYITGSSRITYGFETMFLIRMNSSIGTIPGGFGLPANSNGIVKFNGNNGYSRGNDLMLDTYGNIVVTGFIQTGAKYDMAAWRYTISGIADRSFSQTGYLMGNRLTGYMAEGYGAVITSAGKVVVAGMNVDALGNTDMALWSYTNNCSGGTYSVSAPAPLMSLDVKITPTPVVYYEELDGKNTYSYPNPAAADVNIRFSIDTAQEVNISIYDMAGKMVWDRVIDKMSTVPGVNRLVWNLTNTVGAEVSNGVYLLNVSTKTKTVTKKIAVVR